MKKHLYTCCTAYSGGELYYRKNNKYYLLLNYPKSIYYAIEHTNEWYRHKFKRWIKIWKYRVTHFITIGKKYKPLEQFAYLCIGKLHIHIGRRLGEILRKKFPEKCSICNNNLILKDKTLMYGKIKGKYICRICYEVLKNNQ